MTGLVTVAIPTKNGACVLEQTLTALQAQQFEQHGSLELLVCDSGSRDGTVGLSRSYGADVIEIPPEQFSHGGTRNLLMKRSHGDHVVFLTQDSLPSDERWLARLLEGFLLADNVALAFGPYRPRPDASPMVERELTEWFRSFSPDGSPRVDRLAPSERFVSAHALLGPRGFFTDANGCVARAAWEAVPFRCVPYAEDHVLAHEMLRAGYAKVYVPDAAVIHSHEYSSWDWLRRSFDEARGLRDVYGFVEPLEICRTALKIWGLVGADSRWTSAEGRSNLKHPFHGAILAMSLRHHVMRTAGAVLGSRAERLPASAVKRLSLEGRSR